MCIVLLKVKVGLYPAKLVKICSYICSIFFKSKIWNANKNICRVKRKIFINIKNNCKFQDFLTINNNKNVTISLKQIPNTPLILKVFSTTYLSTTKFTHIHTNTNYIFLNKQHNCKSTTKKEYCVKRIGNLP